ncbi:unnamed protein product [Oppiella nova]|uniref:Uncharacterized protein n=1 Tax=Oppiella nova TaxID=334625 RepID=A0A7R9M373_9ACAR|nr:unnamed protein product [Oppiella nova]CAG2169874.1 unnamed protein product [Oppiella nova]
MAYVLTGNLLTAKADYFDDCFPTPSPNGLNSRVVLSHQTFLELGEMEPKTYNTKGFGDLAAFPKTNAKPKVIVNNISAKWSEV